MRAEPSVGFESGDVRWGLRFAAGRTMTERLSGANREPMGPDRNARRYTVSLLSRELRMGVDLLWAVLSVSSKSLSCYVELRFNCAALRTLEASASFQSNPKKCQAHPQPMLSHAGPGGDGGAASGLGQRRVALETFTCRSNRR